MDFETTFEVLTGHAPFPWQQTLFDRFLSDELPETCRIPTGLGKTSVIAVWLLALAARPGQIPRRLVYVVNRRTVVDQTTNEALRLRDNAPQIGIENLAISTLRGQFADNQTWSADPSRPAIICGTVDMIGSRLLFEGYRIGFKSRPLHAGFLGQDALLIHDEAHLEPAFQQLIESVRDEQKKERQQNGELLWPALRIMALSATARSNDSDRPFALTEADCGHPVVTQRINASKTLRLQPCDDPKMLASDIADLAVKHQSASAAVLIFVHKVDDVGKVVESLKKQDVAETNMATLTGTMRGFERDVMTGVTPGGASEPEELRRSRCVFARFLPPGDRPQDMASVDGTVYLVCTSAGEVGVNLSADHMVCDLSTFDSMAQRLGRVNRFGEPVGHVAQIDVVYPTSFDEKHNLTPARQATLKLLQQLEQQGGSVSPAALDGLPENQRLAAFAPAPEMLDASDILFDAWALTTVRGNMPGRPPVGPYLHGVADDVPQTTIAWRAELELVRGTRTDMQRALRAIFTKHRIRPHELLTTNSYRVADFLQKLKKRTDLHETWVALLFPRELRLTTVGKLIDDAGPLNAEPTLVLPASFGGLDDNGTLSADAVSGRKSSSAKPDTGTADEDVTGDDATTVSSLSLDIADSVGPGSGKNYEAYDNVLPRIRVLIVRTDDGWNLREMPGGQPLPEGWDSGSNYRTSTDLVKRIRRQSGLSVRLVQALETNGEGEDIRSLVCLSPASSRQRSDEQSLADHIDAVEREAARIATELELPELYRSALLFAARWHDEGKRAAIWQRYIGGTDPDQPLGKSAEWRDPKLLAGYRHEFGSLLRLEHPDSEQQASCDLPDDAETRDLALHMIAAHHGYARPHFGHIIDHGFSLQQSEQTHNEAMRRYARLQRKYGRWGLAWLESLLRAADAAASRAIGLDPETDDDLEEGEA